MTPAALIERCRENIASGGDVILLTLPGPPPKRGCFMRLFRTRGPLGEIISTNQVTGASVVRFKASAVLRFAESEPSGTLARE
jgi:hypothetical protein